MTEYKVKVGHVTNYNIAVSTISGYSANLETYFDLYLEGIRTGSTIAVPTPGGQHCLFTVPFNCTITGFTIASDISGSTMIDVLSSGTSLVGTGNMPTLTNTTKTSALAVGWTNVTLVKNDVISLSLGAVSSCKRISVRLDVTRSY